jgi:hypothetical protein
MDGIFINFSLYLSQQDVPTKVQIQYIVVFWFMTVYGLVGWYQPTGEVYCLHLGNRSGMSFYVLNTVIARTLQYRSNFGMLVMNK